MLFSSKNRGINKLNLGLTIRFVSSFFINSLDEMPECKSSQLILIRLIRALRFRHVGHEEEAFYNIIESRFFSPHFKKQIFKRQILPSPTMKSSFQTLLKHANESIRQRKQEIQGLHYPKGSIL